SFRIARARKARHCQKSKQGTQHDLFPIFSHNVSIRVHVAALVGSILCSHLPNVPAVDEAEASRTGVAYARITPAHTIYSLHARAACFTNQRCQLVGLGNWLWDWHGLC